MTLFGSTRSVSRRDYALFTPDGLVNSVIPGWYGATINVVIAPPIGAAFVMLLVAFQADGGADLPATDRQRFVLLRQGQLDIELDTHTASLMPGGYAYLPAGRPHRLKASSPETRLVVYEKPYQPLAGYAPPEPLISSLDQAPRTAFLGDEAVHVQMLLPDTPAFDMAVNTMTFAPGGTLPIVETHVMEHGLLMLQGQGIYRLNDDWYPIQQHDVIWMGPFCPQWFVATGKQTAQYLLYKDVNRPL